MRPSIVGLARRSARDADHFGGKAARLAQLVDLGFSVPPGFAVGTRVFADLLRSLGREGVLEDYPACADDREGLRQAILGAELPARWRRSLNQAYRRLGGTVAVRSSLVGEDGQRASLAGQLTTVLDVAGEQELTAAVCRCFAALFSERFAVYRAGRMGERGGSAEAVSPAFGRLALALVVQRMQRGEVAGVAFSADPNTGERCIIIEASRGDSEGVASGRVAPDSWLVDARGELVAARSADGTTSLLPAERALELAALVRKLAARLEEPVDVEWTWDGDRFWILQARPVTTLTGKRVYSRRLVADMSPGLIKPLLWSTNTLAMTRNVFARLFDQLIGPNDLDFTRLARRIHSRLYTDMTMLGEAFRQVGLPANFFEVMARDERGERPRLRLSWRSGRKLLRLGVFVLRHARSETPLRRFLVVQNRDLEAYRTADWRGAPRKVLLERAERLMELHGRAQWHTFLAAISTMIRLRLLQRFLNRHVPGTDVNELVRGLSGLRALAPNRSLDQLAGLARSLTGSERELLAAGDDTEIRERLAASEAGRRFLGQSDRFFLRFGFLSADGTDFSGKSWVETPTLVWQSVARLAANPPREPEESVARRRRAERDRIRRRLDPLRRVHFDRWLRASRAYLRIRERASLLLSEDAYQMRRVFLALGEGLVADGVGAEPDDVFYLFHNELQRWVAGDLTVATLSECIESRRAEMAADASIVPEETFCGEVAAVRVPDAATPCDCLVGIGGSAGVVEGYARIVHDPAAAPANVGPRDILVVPFTDVGWTPLFAGIGGIIAETGGQLSHTSIVAREYDLPAVVSVRGATSRIRDGQPVTIDGRRGRVYLAHMGVREGKEA
jgi:pyruvate,water dikinase